MFSLWKQHQAMVIYLKICRQEVWIPLDVHIKLYVKPKQYHAESTKYSYIEKALRKFLLDILVFTKDNP